MKRIPLTQGKYALVDNCDYDYLMLWKWYYSNGYANRNDKCKHIYMHHIIAKRMKLRVTNQVDHDDRNKLNNQRYNLRDATRRQQRRNESLRKNNTSGYKGVSLFARDQTWHAQITINSKNKHLGYFPTKKEAAIAYNEAAAKDSGNFAYLNPV